jgi:hypothetical protein
MDDPELPLAIGLKGGKLRISRSSALPPHRAPRCEQVFQRASCQASATGTAEKGTATSQLYLDDEVGLPLCGVFALGGLREKKKDRQGAVFEDKAFQFVFACCS